MAYSRVSKNFCQGLGTRLEQQFSGIDTSTATWRTALKLLAYSFETLGVSLVWDIHPGNAPWGGGGTGRLNLPLPVPFSPGSCPVFVGSHLFAFFWVAKYCTMIHHFPLFLPPPTMLGVPLLAPCSPISHTPPTPFSPGLPSLCPPPQHCQVKRKGGYHMLVKAGFSVSCQKHNVVSGCFLFSNMCFVLKCVENLDLSLHLCSIFSSRLVLFFPGEVKSVVFSGKAPVDSHCSIKDNTHVFTEGDDIWDVMLNQVIFFCWCNCLVPAWFQEISIPTPCMVIGNSEGVGVVSITKSFKGKYEAKLEFLEGWGASFYKTIHGGGMDVLGNHTLSYFENAAWGILGVSEWDFQPEDLWL